MIAQEGIRAYRWLGALGLCAALECSTPSTGSIAQEAVATSMSAYVAGDSVRVDYDNMSGSATDWVAIATAGAPDNKNLQSIWTGGGTSGSKTFRNLAAGSYEARAYFDFYGTYSYTVRYRYSFTVSGISGVTVTTDHASYAVGSSVIVSWTGVASPTSQDYVQLAPAGSAASSSMGWYYTGGTASGSKTFHPSLTPGSSYVARFFRGGTTAVGAESAPFTATAAVVDAGVDSGTDASVDSGAADVVVADTGTDATADASDAQAVCDPFAAPRPPACCWGAGMDCQDGTTCCSGTCFNTLCTAVACNDGSAPCTADSECCGGVCVNGTCPTKKTCSQNRCGTVADCCDARTNDPSRQWACVSGTCEYCSTVKGSTCGNLAGGCCGLLCNMDSAFPTCQ